MSQAEAQAATYEVKPGHLCDGADFKQLVPKTSTIYFGALGPDQEWRAIINLKRQWSHNLYYVKFDI